MKRFAKVTAVTLGAGLVLAPLQGFPSANAGPKPLKLHQLTQLQRRLLSVPLDVQVRSKGIHSNAVQQGADDGNDPAEAPTGTPGSYHPASYQPAGDDSCRAHIGRDIKVNQNCLNISDPDLQGRSQAQNETSIAIDWQHPKNVVATYNDYRRGDGTCGASFSTDGGRSWDDSTVPDGFTRGTAFGAAREYWQAGGDTSVAFDTRGNAYLSCQLFNRGSGASPNPDLSSAFYVFRSTGNAGASWNFPGRPVAESGDPTGSGTADFLDKQLLTVDNHVSSPFRDRVYVSWTTFSATGTAYIYEAYSADYGEHFSAPVLVSGTSSLCSNTFGVPTTQGTCNENQFSQPFTGSDGALYVTWANFNNTPTGADNRNQILLARSTDGGQTFSSPVKVSDYYDLPDCARYQNGQDAGRACVPEKASTALSVFRATNYPSGAVDPKDPRRVIVTVGSYINRHSNERNGCVPTGFNPMTGDNLYTGVKTPGACNNDILLSVSTNAAGSFTGTTADPRTEATVTNARGQATTDQFWQWAAFNRDGVLAVSYYDRQYGHDETTGASDVSLSSTALATRNDRGRHDEDPDVSRVTSSSMPPPTEFSGTFYGDYTGVAAYTDAMPVWIDTRDADLFLCPSTGTVGTPPRVCTATEPNGLLANDQDIFTASVRLSRH